jgi:hypothetical protein
MQFSEILGQEHIKSHLTKAPIWVEFRTHNYLLVLKEAVRYLWRSPMHNTFYVAIKTENITLISLVI